MRSRSSTRLGSPVRASWVAACSRRCSSRRSRVTSRKVHSTRSASIGTTTFSNTPGQLPSGPTSTSRRWVSCVRNAVIVASCRPVDSASGKYSRIGVPMSCSNERPPAPARLILTRRASIT